MRRNSRTIRQISLGALAALTVLVCILLSISQPLGLHGIPSWNDVFGMTGLRQPVPDGTTLRVHVINVGNADAILLQNDGRSLLIDAGENEDGAAVTTYLRTQNVEKLDTVIATHPDSDHIGGMDTVVDNFPVGQFIMAFMPKGYTPTSKTYESLLDALENAHLTVTEAVADHSFSFGNATVTLLAPREEHTDTNDMSVICRITFGERRFLFMGDAEKDEEQDLLNSAVDLRADVLKVAHHGGKTSTSQALLRRVSPRAAVISCGVDNNYGHPHTKTLSRLAEAGVDVYRTDTDGTIIFETDGRALSVTKEGGASVCITP